MRALNVAPKKPDNKDGVSSYIRSLHVVRGGSGFNLVHAQKLEKLVIGYPAPVASLGLIDVTRKAGLFKKHGLDVDLVLRAAMMSGQVPLSFPGGGNRRFGDRAARCDRSTMPSPRH